MKNKINMIHSCGSQQWPQNKVPALSAHITKNQAQSNCSRIPKSTIIVTNQKQPIKLELVPSLIKHMIQVKA